MILYFTGDGQKPEKIFRTVNIMTSFFKSKTNPEKRFRDIHKSRKKEK